MPTYFHSLPVTEIVNAQSIVYPDSDKHLALEDPATLVMVDFLEKRPLVIDGSVSVVEAKNFMKSAHVSLKLVVNASGAFIGIITLKDILGKKALATAHEMGVSLEEIQVEDIMQPVSSLLVVHIEYLKNAKIGDVMETLTHAGAGHLLVIQNDENKEGFTQLRGIISATQTAQKLNISIDLSEKARSFSDIVHAVHGHFD